MARLALLLEKLFFLASLAAIGEICCTWKGWHGCWGDLFFMAGRDVVYLARLARKSGILVLPVYLALLSGTCLARLARLL
jgi:hypothetical protein